MLLMTEKRKKRMGRPPKDPATQPGQRSRKQVAARVRPETLLRLEQFVDRYNEKTRLMTEKSAHVEKAINEYLDRYEKTLDEDTDA